MATRIYTAFMMPNEDSVLNEKVKYWVDVQEEYEKVFEQVFPLAPPSSSLEARESFWYTKMEDGQRFAAHPQQIMGFEELTT